MKFVSKVSLLLFLLQGINAFSFIGHHSYRNTCDKFKLSTQLQVHSNNKCNDVTRSSSTTRKDFLQRLGSTAAAAAVTFVASAMTKKAASAAEEVATKSEEISGIIQSPNLRSLKRAEKQLSKLEFYAVENDYESLKLAIRNAPLNEVRKNSFSLIKEFADRPDKQEKLTASYDLFIGNLEKMDATASLGMRGRKLEKDALLQSYDAVKSSLSDWIAVVTQVSEES